VEIDSDGDGVFDSMEILADTDPDDSTDAPSVGGDVTAEKTNVALNFMNM